MPLPPPCLPYVCRPVVALPSPSAPLPGNRFPRARFPHALLASAAACVRRRLRGAALLTYLLAYLLTYLLTYLRQAEAERCGRFCVVLDEEEEDYYYDQDSLFGYSAAGTWRARGWASLPMTLALATAAVLAHARPPPRRSTCS